MTIDGDMYRETNSITGQIAILCEQLGKDKDRWITTMNETKLLLKLKILKAEAKRKGIKEHGTRPVRR